mgnify:FL=1
MTINGIYKLTVDFDTSAYTDLAPRTVRDINFTPAATRLPDVAICRIFSDRVDAEKILAALQERK